MGPIQFGEIQLQTKAFLRRGDDDPVTLSETDWLGGERDAEFKIMAPVGPVTTTCCAVCRPAQELFVAMSHKGERSSSASLFPSNSGDKFSFRANCSFRIQLNVGSAEQFKGDRILLPDMRLIKFHIFIFNCLLAHILISSQTMATRKKREQMKRGAVFQLRANASAKPLETYIWRSGRVLSNLSFGRDMDKRAASWLAGGRRFAYLSKLLVFMSNFSGARPPLPVASHAASRGELRAAAAWPNGKQKDIIIITALTPALVCLTDN